MTIINIIRWAYAADFDPATGPLGSFDNPINAGNLLELLENVLDILIQYGVAIAAFFIIYSGFLFVTARGNEEKINKAKNTLWWTILGATIVLGAWVIVTVIAETVKTL